MRKEGKRKKIIREVVYADEWVIDRLYPILVKLIRIHQAKSNKK